MNRKQFIESLGGTCSNWNWSWSFINEAEKTIIFGAWDVYDDGNMSLILSENWAINRRGRKANGYPQSREHIRLVEEEGYKLFTFPMIYSEDKREKDDAGPAKIGDFIREVTPKELIRVGGNWFASDSNDSNRVTEEIPSGHKYIEGASKQITVNAYERNGKARKACLDYHGYKCIVCTFDFEEKYGEIGRNFIHVHHKVPLSEMQSEYELDPIEDLAPVCPNCHAIIHRTEPALSIETLLAHIKSAQNT